MPMNGIVQPEYIHVDGEIRLHRFDGVFDFALDWYQDEETVCLVDGKPGCYSMEKLEQMYSYLNRQGELYFIELLGEDGFVPVGDVTFWREDIPIVIGEKDCRGKGVGRRVVSALVKRARELGFEELYVDEIYDFNEASRKCFEAVGFREDAVKDRGKSYKLILTEEV